VTLANIHVHGQNTIKRKKNQEIEHNKKEKYTVTYLCSGICIPVLCQVRYRLPL
jgi:hypothetical protein